jgi:hypothetical protein
MSVDAAILMPLLAKSRYSFLLIFHHRVACKGITDEADHFCNQS